MLEVIIQGLNIDDFISGVAIATPMTCFGGSSGC
jgi:hypothetical protein